MRTTVDIDEPLLRELKAIQKREGKALGRLVSDLLVSALDSRRAGLREATVAFRWAAKPMGARVDFSDREALYDLMDEGDAP